MNIKSSILTLSAALLLGACVEGSLNLSEGGMTGSGISTGRITGFGSIYVNGIHYNVDNATFYRDGEAASSQTSFNMGEYVTVSGITNDEGSEGIASSVSFDSLLRGVVTKVSTDNQTLSVMGQTINTDVLTLLHGIEQLNDLVSGNVVEVSGSRDENGIITASSIALLANNQEDTSRPLKLQGIVQQLSTKTQTLQLDNLTVDYSSAQLYGFDNDQPALANGQRIQLKTQQLITENHVIASSIKLNNKRKSYDNNTRLELEGIITRMVAPNDFYIDEQLVLVDENTHFIGQANSELTLGSMLEIEGYTNSDMALVAKKISLRNNNQPAASRLNGTIQSLNLTAKTLTLNSTDNTLYNLTIDSTSLLIGGRDSKNYRQQTQLELLNVGDVIEVHAAQEDNNTLRVLRLDLKN